MMGTPLTGPHLISFVLHLCDHAPATVPALLNEMSCAVRLKYGRDTKILQLNISALEVKK